MIITRSSYDEIDIRISKSTYHHRIHDDHAEERNNEREQWVNPVKVVEYGLVSLLAWAILAQRSVSTVCTVSKFVCIIYYIVKEEQNRVESEAEHERARDEDLRPSLHAVLGDAKREADDAHAVCRERQHVHARYKREYLAQVGAHLAHPRLCVVPVKVEEPLRVDLVHVANGQHEQEANVAHGQPRQVVARAQRVLLLGPQEDQYGERVAHDAEQNDERPVPDGQNVE